MRNPLFYWACGIVLLAWGPQRKAFSIQWQYFPLAPVAGIQTTPSGQFGPLMVWPSSPGDASNYGPLTDTFLPGPPSSPPTLYYGLAQLTTAGGQGWIRLTMLVPPTEAYPVSEPAADYRSLATYPQVQGQDLNGNFQILGSQFTDSATMCQGVIPTWGTTNFTVPSSVALPSPGQPMRVGLNLPAVSPSLSAVAAGWVSAGPSSSANTWVQIPGPWAPPGWDGFDAFLIGGASTTQTSTGNAPFVFTSLFSATGSGATLVVNPSLVTVSSPSTNTINDWIIYNGGLQVSSSGSLTMTGQGSLLEFFNLLEVDNGGSLQSSGASVFSGPKVTILANGVTQTGETHVESANCRLQQGTWQVTPIAAGGHPYGMFLEGGSMTTIGAGTSLLGGSSSILIQPDAVLAGLGSVTATGGVVVQGRIAPGDGRHLGPLTVQSSPVQFDSGSSVLASTLPLSNSELVVNSSVARAGSFLAQMLQEPGAVYTEGSRYILFNATSVTGAWDSLRITTGNILSPFLSARLIDDSTQVILEIDRTQSYVDTALCPLQISVARALDCARILPFTTTELRHALQTTVDYFTEEQLSCGCVWDQLSGAEYADQLLAGAEIGYSLNRVLQSEIWRSQDVWAMPATYVSNRTWLSGYLADQRFWDSDAVFPMKNDQRGLLAGVDMTTRPGWLFGAAFHTAGANSHWEGLSGNGLVKDFGGALYIGWSRPDRWVIDGWTGYVTASGSLGYTQSSMERTPLCDMCTSSDASGVLLAGRLEGGFRVDCSACLVQPYVALQGSRWARHAFCEEVHGPALGLAEHDAADSLTCLTPGVRVSSVMNTLSGMRFSPEVVVEVNQYLDGRSPVAFLTFEGSCCPYKAFNTHLPARTVLFGLGAELAVTPQFLIQLRGQVEGSPGFNSKSGSLELSYRF